MLSRSRPPRSGRHGHPHVERAAEAKRETALGLVKLHRGDPDVHHHAIDSVDALRGANFGKIGKPVLDRREPAVRSIAQTESGRHGRPVAVDADDPGTGGVEDGPAVTARTKGGIDINAAGTGLKHPDRLAAEDGNMALAGRIHAPAPGGVRATLRKLDARGPIAPQISALRRAIRLEKPLQGAIADSARPGSQTLISRWNLVGCHGTSSVKKGPRPSPQTVRLFTT